MFSGYIPEFHPVLDSIGWFWTVLGGRNWAKNFKQFFFPFCPEETGLEKKNPACRVAALQIWSFSVEQSPKYDMKCDCIFNNL